MLNTGANNTATGANALVENTSGNNNSAFGTSSLFSNRANSRSTAIGFGAMQNADDRATGRETFNTAVGFEALKGSATPANNIGLSNTAVGDRVLWSNENGNLNTGLGAGTLLKNTTGAYNTATGANTLPENTSGHNNTASGASVLLANNTGYFNTAMGNNALVRNTSGYGNTSMGMNSLRNNVSGFYNTAIGAGADVAAPGLTNATAVGYAATATANNQIRLGNGAVTEVLPGSNCLATLGNAASKWKEVWACNGVIQTSDSRLKSGISKINYGLKEVMSMRPVQYYWKDNSEQGRILGFVAQDMESLVPESVVAPKNEEEYYAMKYDALIPVLTKAIQEQQAQIETLKMQNAQLGVLAQQNESLQTQLDEMRAEMQAFVRLYGQQVGAVEGGGGGGGGGGGNQ
ncbi:MAG: tail fiber domain-containing protein [Lewinellaceae bacterium]|nr:tail fiber domain-containing protein [Lewinellaceae bacterium]